MRCPECDGRVTWVVMTCWQRDGRVVRRRGCKACDHRWYTLQAAEVPIDKYQLRWERGKAIVRERKAS